MTISSEEHPRGTDVARLHLLGPVRLVDARGQDITPRGGVRRAILAVLALSHQGTISRLTLQDLFWGDRDAQKGASSLRNALSVLKRDLISLGEDLISTDGQSIRLDVSRLWIDVQEYIKPENHDQLRKAHGARLPELIEGINVRAAGDEEFEDWMRSERRYWCEKLEPILDQVGTVNTAHPDPVAAQPSFMVPQPERRESYGVGLLTTVAKAQNPHAAMFGDTVLDAVASSLRDQTLTEIYDYRDNQASLHASYNGVGPLLLLQVKLFQDQDRLNMTLLVYRTSEQKLLWSWPIAARYTDGLNFDNEAISNFISQGVDRVGKTLHDIIKRDPHAHVATPYHALNTMFRLDNESSAQAQMMLKDAHSETGESVHQSLLAYLNSFRVGEHWETYDQEVVEQSRGLVQEVLDNDPFNSVTLTMAGHTAGYILHDFSLSGDLLKRAVELNPTLAIAWDHIALHHMYCSRYDKAMEAAQTALRLGAFSPLRFTFETTMCMVATLRGDHATAVEHGNRVLAQRPNFGAALRYMSVSLAHLGRDEDAHQLVSRIKTLAPDFSRAWVLGNRLAVTDDHAKKLLISGFEKAGA